MKAPAAKPPQLNENMTLSQFGKLKMDWDVFQRITNLPENQIHSCTMHVVNLFRIA